MNPSEYLWVIFLLLIGIPICVYVSAKLGTYGILRALKRFKSDNRKKENDDGTVQEK